MTYRILSFDFQTTYLEPMLRSFRDLGHEVCKLSVKDKTLIAIRQEIQDFRPDFCFLVDFKAFEFCSGLEEIVSELRLFSVVWFTDDPEFPETFRLSYTWQFGPYPKSMFFFVPSQRHLDFLRSKNLNAARYKLCIDERVFTFKPSTEQKRRLQGGPAFVGSPLAPNRDPLYTDDDVMRFHCGFTLKFLHFRLREYFPNREEFILSAMSQLAPLVRKVFLTDYSPESFFLQGKQDFFESIPSEFLLEFGKFLQSFWYQISQSYSWFQLTKYLRFLEKSVGLRIYGGPYWRNVLNSTQCLESLSREDFFAISALSSVSFSFKKFQLHEAIHERVGIAFGSGGFAITEWCDDLEFLGASRSIAYTSMEEASDKVIYYEKNFSERERISQKIRERVMAECGYQKRAAEMLDTLYKEAGI